MNSSAKHSPASARQKVSDMLLKGARPFEIRERFPHVSGSTISKCRARLDLKPFPRGRRATGRTLAILAYAARLKKSSGLSFNRSAQHFGISRQRLEQMQHPERHRARVARYQARLRLKEAA